MKHFFEKMMVFLFLSFFVLGCVPAYFEYYFYAVTLWVVGSAVLNIFVFYMSRRQIHF